jgi:hypothetical protein
MVFAIAAAGPWTTARMFLLQCFGRPLLNLDLTSHAGSHPEEPLHLAHLPLAGLEALHGSHTQSLRIPISPRGLGAGKCSLLARAPYIRLAACATECLLAQMILAGAFCVCVAVGMQRTGSTKGGCFKETGTLENCMK